jgi:hypothetical protein
MFGSKGLSMNTTSLVEPERKREGQQVRVQSQSWVGKMKIPT